jgi:hypothetical protein
MKVELPLLQEGSDAATAFKSMKSEQRSGAVLRVRDGYRLIKAGSAFRAVRQGLDLTLVGEPIAIEDVTLSAVTATIEVIGLIGSLLERGPAACFCPNCDEATPGPGNCPVCGTTLECQ